MKMSCRFLRILFVLCLLNLAFAGSQSVTAQDLDGDGFDMSVDCNDNDSLINPDAAEICDNIDNNCDGNADEGLTFTTYYWDGDMDGYGDKSSSGAAFCFVPGGLYVLDNTDCNDWDSLTNPGAAEICDAMDNNCDGNADEGLTFTTYYQDNDGDGYGYDWWSQNICYTPDSAWTSVGGDCNDWDMNMHPGATEICDELDNDCNGMYDDGVPRDTYYRDYDMDGYGRDWDYNDYCMAPGLEWSLLGGDCDDWNMDVNPAATEICDFKDNNCNNETDEGVTTTYYRDYDGDGYGDMNWWENFCASPWDSTWILTGGDCNDYDPMINPSSMEICDNFDNNCNDTINEGYTDSKVYHYDGDRDGYGSDWNFMHSCVYPGEGWILFGGDCRDWDEWSYPGADEKCDGQDNDCDTLIDEGFSESLTYYYDWDKDGYGQDWNSMQSCVPPTDSNYVLLNGDCNDWNMEIHPGATEICDNNDNDCNGMNDDGLTMTTYYRDWDKDGYGEDWWSQTQCEAPMDSNWALIGGDCDNWNPMRNPGMSEICDDMDNNCDTLMQVDEGLVVNTYYKDEDNDGYGGWWSITSCKPPLDSNWVLMGGDCNNWDPAIHPGATEICDGIDNNCDSLLTVDEGFPVIPGDWYYRDNDGDSFGRDNFNWLSCDPGPGFVTNWDDCNDMDAAINPSAAEVVCDGMDNNCDGVVDEGAPDTLYIDNDGDGFGSWQQGYFCSAPTDTSQNWVTINGDCDDYDMTVYPGNPELCDGKDNNCDGSYDEGLVPAPAADYYYDGDGDGYGSWYVGNFACSAIAGYVTANGDCYDDNPMVYPTQTDLCNGMDDDCDGSVDEDATFSAYYYDYDGDGYGSDGWAENFCSVPDSLWASMGGDCNDGNFDIHPGAVEICDYLDNDCNGMDDDGLTFETYYRDYDGDGFGVDWDTKFTCSVPDSGWALLSGDCDDWNMNIHPGATEICDNMDNNCDGMWDEGLFTTYYRDYDRDGFGQDAWTQDFCNLPDTMWAMAGGDCDDWNPNINPGMMELCDDIDNNCDGQVNEGLPMDSLMSYFNDWDMDGYGGGYYGNYFCNPGLGYSTIAGDCNDWEATVHPDAIEVCDGWDNDCNGMIDDGFSQSMAYYADADTDSYGNDWNIMYACSDPGFGWTLTGGDCNDWNPMIHPDAIEICDGMDNNCDGKMDDSTCSVTTYYRDNDGDGFGSWPENFSFDPGFGWSLLGGDCEDWKPNTHPGATEICDGYDNNCDGDTDEGFINSTVYYYDGDMDGFGDDNNMKQTCSSVSPIWVLMGGDCQPWNPMAYPGAVEVCNEMDDNCDGMVDEGFTKLPYYRDYDMDGYGGEWIVWFCEAPMDTLEWRTNTGDCADWDMYVHPGATEICNGKDDNCNGFVDEGLAGGSPEEYYRDWDMDGFGGEWVGTLNCSPDSSLITIGGDCDDWNPMVNPAAVEVECNYMDDNCDGITDEGSSFMFYSDYDNDGFGGAVGYFCDPNPGNPWILIGGDCADWDPMINPMSMEICDGQDNNCDGMMDDSCTTMTYYYDGDNDGFGGWAKDFSYDPGMPWILTGGDCDDYDMFVYPGATEVCDGKDNNCDGETDEGFAPSTPTAYYYDWDMDGYGRDFAGVFFCTPSGNYTDNFGDCDDMNPMTNPDGIEACDGMDNNCNGEVDEGFTNSLVYFKDNDMDGFGNDWDNVHSCDSLGWPWTLAGGDCQDWNPDVNPGALEICDNMDNNCDSLRDEGFSKTTYYEDLDRDGYGANGMEFCEDPGMDWSLIDGDCNNWDMNIYPGATEVCNGMDDNCDGTVDEGFPESMVYYLDNDADGYGNNNESMRFCVNPGMPWVVDGGDCYDWDPSIYPGATEVCNGMDDNCDGTIDEGFSTTTYYYDNDDDSFGNDWSAYESCMLPAATGWVTIGGDCNDDNAEVHPGAIEICNEMDDNCDGTVDEGFSKTSYYRDYDMDGFGDDMYKMDFCSAPDSGWTLTGGDCYDWFNGINPGAPEICDGIDNNCNGETDEGLTGGTGDFYYFDWDGDGFGGDSAGVLNCNSGSGFSLVGGDCDDGNPMANPGMSEITCNNVDDNCDGMTDEGSPFVYYADWDGDGFAGSTPYYFCFDPGAPYSANVAVYDCNDTQNMENPAGTEICDGLDNNCDGVADEGFSPVIYYADWDGDGFGNTMDKLIACVDPGTNYTTTGGDCADSDASINPLAVEICNGLDDDCDGTIENGVTFTDWYYDGDGDGFGNDLATICYTPDSMYVANGGDCADTDPLVNPGTVETCDNMDNNCDGNADEGLATFTYFMDADADSFGDDSTSAGYCADPGAPYTLSGGDCNDGDAAINPSATEVVDSVDNNCDGSIDNVSISEKLNTLNNSFEIYPIPATKVVYLKFSGKSVNDRMNVKVFDVKGKLVYSDKLSSLKENDIITLDVKNLHQGIYQVKIEGTSFKSTNRIMVAE